MPNTREKLIELIQSAVDGCATYWAGLIADHLIANGVRLEEKQATSDKTSEWIPVSERLPDRWQNVLSVSKYGKIGVDYVFTDGSWWSDRDVTHWMHLPEPPKGE